MRRWLDDWRVAGARLERERRARLRSLTDADAWRESQQLLQMWEPGMTGDHGRGLELHQAVFARARTSWPRR
jgi:hypothetical protein